MIGLKANHLSFSVKTHCLLSDLHFEAPKPSFLAVLGPNGAGKSTLVHLIIGRNKASAGEVEVLGRPARKLSPQEIGYVPQRKSFDPSFPACVEEFVLSGENSKWPFWISSRSREKVKAALGLVNAEVLLKKPLVELSGGELQRVYLARAFVRPRQLLIMDEPAAGVDNVGEADLYKILENYARKHQAMIIMVTHDIEVARHHASHVLILNQKQIAFGEPSKVLNQENLDRAFGHSQHAHPHEGTA